MSQPAKARLGQPPAQDPITISPAGTGYSPDPVNSSVANDGEVSFISSGACWIWTFVNQTLVNVFAGEQNHYVPCIPGNNGPFTLAVQDATITFVPSAVNSNPPPFPIEDSITVDDTIAVDEDGREEIVSVEETITSLETFTVHGTIKVGSG
jgi:hypothetical protein